MLLPSMDAHLTFSPRTQSHDDSRKPASVFDDAVSQGESSFNSPEPQSIDVLSFTGGSWDPDNSLYQPIYGGDSSSDNLNFSPGPFSIGDATGQTGWSNKSEPSALFPNSSSVSNPDGQIEYIEPWVFGNTGYDDNRQFMAPSSTDNDLLDRSQWSLTSANTTVDFNGPSEVSAIGPRFTNAVNGYLDLPETGATPALTLGPTRESSSVSSGRHHICRKCERPFPSSKELARHSIVHNPKSVPLPDGSVPRGSYGCICKFLKHQLRKDGYQRHLRMCKAKNPVRTHYTCYCGRTHARKEDHVAHIASCGRRSAGRPPKNQSAS